jgi:dihydrofolate reductase
MRRLVVNTFVSLDGIMQAPGAPEEDRSVGFSLGGWSVNYWDDVTGQAMAEASGPHELLLGRGTYEIFAAHWPHVSDDPVADQLNRTRKHVASRTLERVDWNNSTLIAGDVAEYVAQLKRQDGSEIQVHGSAGLIQTLIANDLIDVFGVWTFPLLLGAGKRLFGDGTAPAALNVTDNRLSTTGVTITIYERAGDIQAGSFALQASTEAELERRRRIAPR